ncbi:hypothetical protein D5H75_12400 [Bailinhaonella thermotolerans]|uniref:Putative Flp pilus-assembly TadG-like N-terminal domain-containing protein n=2 Tax=Bailinhaonella thermotolerans TaxID=1070861 RepID=A0A3A4AZ62_9ACTN|nr:hypothetical protein D5H75_12400 [Bailinhaonella thermotolerans]
MSVFVVLFSVAVFFMAGLLVDGGAAINARLRAADIAEQGARAGADQIDEEHLRETGNLRILDGEACAKAEEIVNAHDEARAEMTGCDQAADSVTVTVTVTGNSLFLGLLGFATYEMEGAATAGPNQGTQGVAP